MSDEEGKPRRVRRRRATGRVGGTSQSAFATNSMTSILQKQSDVQAEKKKVNKAKPDEAGSEDEKAEKE